MNKILSLLVALLVSTNAFAGQTEIARLKGSGLSLSAANEIDDIYGADSVGTLTVSGNGTIGGTLAVTGNLTIPGLATISSTRLSYSTTPYVIAAASGTTSIVSISGGNTDAGTTGAYLSLAGNTNAAGQPGEAIFHAGNVTNGRILFRTSGTQNIDHMLNSVISFKEIPGTGGATFLRSATALNTDVIDVAGGTPSFAAVSDSDTGSQFLAVATGADASGNHLYAFKTRATTDAATTAVIDDDELLKIRGHGSDGVSDYRRAASIDMFASGTFSATSSPGKIIFKTTPAASVTLLNRITLESDGDLLFDATNGGNLILAKPASSIISGVTALSANVTAIAGTAIQSAMVGDSDGGAQYVAVANGADASGNLFYTFKTRATTDAATTAVVVDDELLKLRGHGSDGAGAYRRATSIDMFADGTFSATSSPGRIEFKTTPTGTVGLVTNLTLEADGDLLAAQRFTSSRATDLGWSIVDITDNLASGCNAGCTSACVFGIANATGTAVTTLLACTDNTADLCACAGAS